MNALLVGVAVVLLASVLVGLGRVVAGPTGRDRLLGVVLLGTTGTAALAVLAAVADEPALRDAALVLVVLAVVVVAVSTRSREERP